MPSVVSVAAIENVMSLTPAVTVKPVGTSSISSNGRPSSVTVVGSVITIEGIKPATVNKLTFDVDVVMRCPLFMSNVLSLPSSANVTFSGSVPAT